MAEGLSPFVYWGQNSEKIFLKVDLKDVKDQEINLDDDQLQFKACGIGLRGLNKYSFELEFYLPVDSKACSCKATGRHIEFQLIKQGKGECWPRLTISQKKPAWLKIDFDHLAVEDDSDDREMTPDEGMSADDREFMKKLEKEIKDVQSPDLPSMKTLWLFTYNMLQWVGYTYVFAALCYRYWILGEEAKSEALATVGNQLMFCQLVAFLEIFHPLLGIVKTGIMSPVMQVMGRNFVLFMVILPEPYLHDKEIIWWLFLIWSCVEIIRYPFYMLSTVGKEIKTITWLRYTMWIPLYPLGFLCEGIVMMTSMPFFETTGRWTLQLPNIYNISFDFPLFMKLYLAAFAYGNYALLTRMYNQWKTKILKGGSSRKDKAA